MTRRAVVTGIGIMAPSGRTSDEHWQTIVSTSNRLGPISLFDPSSYPTQVAGEVGDIDLRSKIEGRIAVQTDRWTRMALVASDSAAEDAELDLAALDPYDLSVVMASSSGGNDFGQRELQRLWSDPARTVGVYQSIAWFYAATVGQVSIRYQAKGPSSVLASESAGGLSSLAHAARLVRRGAPVVLAGGLEAPLSPYALACQLRSGRLNPTKNADGAYLPFDASAKGFVPGEGGVVFVVEELGHALARNAPTIYGEITGAASTHDGAHTGTRQSDNSRQYSRAMQLALDRAETEATDVDLLIPDAVGIPECDLDEANAVRRVFGSHRVPVTTHKSLVGRLYQGGAALDAATALLAMKHQTLPVSAGPDNPADGCELAFVRETTSAPIDRVLIGARGFDGYNSALVLARHDRENQMATAV